jgi:hypothetical protein
VRGSFGGVNEARFALYANRVIQLYVGDKGAAIPLTVKRRVRESVEEAVKRKIRVAYEDATFESFTCREEEPMEQLTERTPPNSPMPERSPMPTPTDAPDPKRSRVLANYDASAFWSDYDKDRIGSRHYRVRGETYCELKARADEQARELKGLYGRLEEVFAALRSDGERAAAEVLAEVMLEALDEGESNEGELNDDARMSRGSARMRAGCDLRAALLEVNRLLRLGKTKAAEQKMGALQATAAATDVAKRVLSKSLLFES